MISEFVQPKPADYIFILKAGIVEKNIKQVISSSYYSAKPKVIFLSSPMIRPGGKDPILKYKQSMVVYQFNCFCEDSYVGMTSRQFD